MFLREWFGANRIVPQIPTDAVVVARSRGWDCAATSGGGDYSAGVRVALTNTGQVYIEHVVRGQWGPTEFEGPTGVFVSTIRMDPPWTRHREEEEGGSSGKKVIAAHALLLHGFDYLGVRSTGDKATRAKPFRTQCAIGNVWLVQGAWNMAWIDEICQFRDDGSDQVDDQVDATSCAYNEVALNANQTARVMAVRGW
jgi:predicted phage terminase large subunit-like protein